MADASCSLEDEKPSAWECIGTSCAPAVDRGGMTSESAGPDRWTDADLERREEGDRARPTACTAAVAALPTALPAARAVAANDEKIPRDGDDEGARGETGTVDASVDETGRRSPFTPCVAESFTTCPTDAPLGDEVLRVDVDFLPFLDFGNFLVT